MSERQKYTRKRRDSAAEHGSARATAPAPQRDDGAVRATVPSSTQPAPRRMAKAQTSAPVPQPAPQPTNKAEQVTPKRPTPQASDGQTPRPRRVVVTETKKPARPRPADAPVVLPSSARSDVTPPLILTPQDMPEVDPVGLADEPTLKMPEFKDKAQPVLPEPAVAREPVASKPAAQSVPRSRTAPSEASDVWSRLGTLPLSAAHLERNRIISATRRDPAHTAFDVLRTRLLQALDDNGWKRVAITSPTKDCGKTFIAANLAMSLSRQEACRTLLLDMDLRAPSLAKVMGASDPGSIGDFLRGHTAPEDHFMRLGDAGLSIGRNIAVGLNGVPEGYASELLQLPDTADVLDKMHSALRPDVVLYDMPPALFHDDVMAFRPHIDGVLLVIGGGITKASEVKEVERRLGTSTPLLGIIMNKAEGPTVSTYSY